MVEQQTIDKLVANLKQARKLIKEFEAIGIPEIERDIRIADINLHYALWACGEASIYSPDLPLEE